MRLSGDPLALSVDDVQDPPASRTSLARSFSTPYPPLEGIAEEASSEEPWQWESRRGQSPSAEQQQQQQLQPSPGEEEEEEEEEQRRVSEEDYQRALRVEGYILGLIQQHTLTPRPCQPRTTLNPDLLYGQHRRTPAHTPERRPLDPRADLSANPESQAWGCDLLQGEAPSLEEDCYLALPYPRPRPLSLAGGPPPPPPTSLHPGGGMRTVDLCYRPESPLHSPSPRSPSHYSQELVCAQYIPGQGCHAPLYSPSHYAPGQLKSGLLITSPDQPQPPTKHRGPKKSHHDGDRQASRKASTKTSRSQSENSLLGQRGFPERRYSTTERPQGRKDPALKQAQQGGGPGAGRRWCSNLELSQDEGETQTAAGPGHRRPSRRTRQGPAAAQSQPRTHHHHHHHHQQQQQQPQHSHGALPQHSDCPERAPICRAEGGYATRAAPGESESSMSEVYSRASSSLSSDSDESGGLVWPQQLPPRLAPSSSSSSSSPQASADPASASAQPKAFVKIKASHALKKKILRFRSGSLKVMTTV